MFGLSVVEILVILLVALIVFGPHQLPRLASRLGKTLRELRQATQELKAGLETDLASEAVTKPAPASPPAAPSAAPEKPRGQTQTADDEQPAASKASAVEGAPSAYSEAPIGDGDRAEADALAPLAPLSVSLDSANLESNRASKSEVERDDGPPDRAPHRPDAGI
ncbi:MAG: twin-arginine translocase TatA/TatE family subunit [Myxococcales bacterium]|jgi:TatA/E family protein of Tat protein translocase|nr:twin-arginine translocase TatA/TatE family subunit [Myxococcales bacterium]